MTPDLTDGSVHVIRDPEQLKALRTPTRHRVLNAIMELGACSVADVATRLDWKPESLYYHIKALQSAGLIRQAGERPGERRNEALYESVASEIQLDDRNRSKAYLSRVGDAYRAALRASERDLAQALEREEHGSGPRRNTMLHQTNVRVSEATAERLRCMMDAVVQFAVDHEDRAESEALSVTLVLSRVHMGASEETG